MTIGVATANSILMVVFANDERTAGKDRLEAALNAGYTRLRPVIMTALAMIIGMLPMALALGEGGEQNAPLGRAVIGGLLFATVGTLFIVPVIYSLLKKNAPVDFDQAIDSEYGPRPGRKPASGEPYPPRPETAGATRLMPNYESDELNPHPGQKLLPAHDTDEAHRLSDGRSDIGEAFADPNAMDDAKLGHSFEETNSSAKKHHRPVKQVVSETVQKARVTQGAVLGHRRYGGADGDRADRRDHSAAHDQT